MRKTNSGCLLRECEKVKITPRYAVRNRLIRTEGVTAPNKMKILMEYGKQVKERLLRGDTYTISSERNGRQERKALVLIVKQVKKGKGYFGNLQKLQSKIFKDRVNIMDCVTKPTLKLMLETENGRMNKIKIKIDRTLLFGKALSHIDTEKRYEFPKN